MAKKKAADLKAAGTNKPKQGTITVYKADAQKVLACKEWLQGLADHVGAPITITIDMALKAFAESRGYKAVMPKRQVRSAPRTPKDPTSDEIHRKSIGEE